MGTKSGIFAGGRAIEAKTARLHEPEPMRDGINKGKKGFGPVTFSCRRRTSF